MLRSPIVVILGHVDHGKTTLLDAFRPVKKSLTSKEAGGITQSIGAYYVNFDQKYLTFIDTPGHAAFETMRRRGAEIADIAVLVVAADDGVMPQTIEALKHIQAAKIPYVVAINKIDLTENQPLKIKKQLAEHGCLVEGYGGDVPVVEISAKNKTNLSELLEIIWLAYALDGKENLPCSPLRAVVVDSRQDKRMGPLVSIIIYEGTIRLGDKLTAGDIPGKVKSMTDDLGQRTDICLPGQPVQILGFSGVPPVGAIISGKSSADLSTKQPPAGSDTDGPQSDKIKEADNEQANFVLRADSFGTLEALKGVLPKTGQIISSQVGNVSGSDILLAESTKSIIVAFRVEIPRSVKLLAENQKIKILSDQIIYQLMEQVELLEKAAEPVETETGRAGVLRVFPLGKITVAGCKVESGKLQVGDSVWLVAGPNRIPAKITNIKQGKTDISTAPAGTECGILLEPENSQKLNFAPGNAIISIRKTA